MARPNMPPAYTVDDALLRELLSTLSHDLRNPLAAIVTNLEFARRLAQRNEADPDLRETVEDSVTACDVLRRMVSNLDVLVRGEQLVTSMHESALGPQLESVVKRCADRAAQVGIAIELKPVADARRAMVDTTLFNLTLENLLANSIQHAPRGSTIRVSAEFDDDAARILVEDDGKPIPTEQRDLALSAEGHVRGARKLPLRYGRGLGLLAARAAAEATGLTLELDCTDEGGCMRLMIPLIDRAR
jgi:signal transduction histidine kinase